MVLDVSVSTESQIPNVARSAFYHLWQVRLLVPYLSPCDSATVIHAALKTEQYAGLPLRLTGKLQLVLCQLCWLPVDYWVKYNVMVLAFKVLCLLGPTYL